MLRPLSPRVETRDDCLLITCSLHNDGEKTLYVFSNLWRHSPEGKVTKESQISRMISRVMAEDIEDAATRASALLRRFLRLDEHPG